jgi:hypothetical protein
MLLNPSFCPWALYAQPMEKYSGTPIEAHEAWQMFDRWRSRDVSDRSLNRIRKHSSARLSSPRCLINCPGDDTVVALKS